MRVRLDDAVADSVERLFSHQKADGHIVFDLEADATISAEYILLNHYLDEREPDLEARLARYIRAIQEPHGAWGLFRGGAIDISCSVKAYYALKIAGDGTDAPHMARARAAILAAGGAEKANVFTRYQMALFAQVPWRAIPVMPVELMLLPRWFPVTVWRFSYWSRTVITPLLVLAALKPQAKNPLGIGIAELFRVPPDKVKVWQTNPTGRTMGDVFLWLDKVLRVVEPLFPKALRRKAIDAAVAFFTPRLNGEDGLGAIYPAMANAVMAMEALGYPKDHPALVTAKKSIRLLVSRGAPTPDHPETFVQPCVSPVWDTSLSTHALLEAGVPADDARIAGLCAWMRDRQVLDVKGDWAEKAPDLPPGGWAFQYGNAYYPDVDDTAVVGMALHRADRLNGSPTHAMNIERAVQWVIGMQSSNGGWGAFDIDNNDDYLNSIPFADHGALLDPPTEDVSARCLSFLAQTGHDRAHPAIARGIAYLKATQQPDGSWYGRWGTNYIYGSWSVLCALNAVGEDMSQPWVRRCVDWLLACQRDDGGWGEDGATYWQERRTEARESTASQTAWALLGLMAAGEAANPAVRRGVDFLLAAPREADGRWTEPWYTAVGFPRVFYLRYLGYAAFFPLWALARYRTLTAANDPRVAWGM